jgi:hypothetical protein
LNHIEPALLKEQLLSFAPPDAQRILNSSPPERQ